MVEEEKKVEGVKEVEKEAPAREAPVGLRIKRTRPADVIPPLTGEEVAEEIAPEVRVAAEGKIPISPAVVKPLLRFEGIVLAETTGYKGWLYTEEDLENIAELVQQCGLTATPMIQLFLALGGMHAERGMGWVMWKKAGKPDAMSMNPAEEK